MFGDRKPARDTIVERLFNQLVFAVFLLLWAAFAYGLVANQAGLDAAWHWLERVPLPLQLVVALLTLPL